MSSEEIRVKGICFYDFIDIMCRDHGQTAPEQIAAKLEGELAQEVREASFVKGVWYPIAWYRKLHAAAQESFDAGPELSYRVGRQSTKDDLGSGIYKIFVRVASPQFILGTGAMVFKSYYENATMRITEKGSGFAVAECAGCRGFDANIWQDVRGGMVGALEVAGGKEVSARIESGGGEGDAQTVFSSTWS